DPAHRFGKDVDLERVQLAVSPLDRSGCHKISGFDICEAPFCDAEHREIIGEPDCHLLTVTRFHLEALTVERLDGTANSRGHAVRSSLRWQVLAGGWKREQHSDRDDEQWNFPHKPPPLFPSSRPDDKSPALGWAIRRRLPRTQSVSSKNVPRSTSNTTRLPTIYSRASEEVTRAISSAVRRSARGYSRG